LNDLLSRSGGQTAVADMSKATITRGTTVVWNGADVQTALIEGMTVQSLGLRPGDELTIAEKKQRSWLMPAIQIGTTVAALVFTLFKTR
jgi:hypothetical protein